jgi:phage repressor protein C with HTH and peptisase S24 domain
MDALLAFSAFYKLSIDTLIKVDLSKISERQIQDMQMGNDPYISGTQLRVLATTVLPDNTDNIELVPEKAKAGYTSGYADPEYIEQLPVFSLPMVKKDRKYRTFPITGDSMLPIPSGSWVTAEYMDDWRTIRNGEACILVTHSEGIVFKIVENNLQTDRSLRLISLNPAFDPYTIEAADVCEVWRFVHYISERMPEPPDATAMLARQVAALQADMASIRSRMG